MSSPPLSAFQTPYTRRFLGSSSAAGTATTPWTTSTSSRSPRASGTTCRAGATCRPRAIATAPSSTAARCSSLAAWTSGRRGSRTSASSASTQGPGARVANAQVLVKKALLGGVSRGFSRVFHGCPLISDLSKAFRRAKTSFQVVVKSEDDGRPAVGKDLPSRLYVPP